MDGTFVLVKMTDISVYYFSCMIQNVPMGYKNLLTIY